MIGTRNNDEAEQPGQDVRRCRRRRVRAIIVAMVVVIVGVLAWVWWRESARAELRREIDAIRDRGEPVKVAEMMPPALDPNDNAAVPLREAGRVYETDVRPLIFELDSKMEADGWESFGLSTLLEHRKLRTDYREDIRAILVAAGPVLKLVRESRRLDRGDWGGNYVGPDYGGPANTLAWQRPLVRFLSLAAIVAQDAGNDDDAIEYVRDTMAIAEFMESGTFLAYHLVAMAEHALSTRTIETIAPALQVGQDDKRASPEQVLELIRVLRDEKRAKQGLVRASLASRILAWEDCRRLRLDGERGRAKLPGLYQYAVARGIMSPMLIRGEAWALRTMAGNVEAARQDTWPAAEALVPQLHVRESSWRVLKKTCKGFLPSGYRVLILHFRAIAQRRMAATALAMRLYEIDHGRRPKKLADLVPKYLPAVPKDPFDAGGREISYQPDANQPLLYSVHLNGTDDDGNYDDPMTEPFPYEQRDLPFFLEGGRPIRPLDKKR